MASCTLYWVPREHWALWTLLSHFNSRCVFACLGVVEVRNPSIVLSPDSLMLSSSTAPQSVMLLRLAALGLLLACALSPSSSASILENGMPILWAQTSSQVTELPVENGLVTLSLWHEFVPAANSCYRSLHGMHGGKRYRQTVHCGGCLCSWAGC